MLASRMSDFNKSNVGCRMSDVGCRMSDFNKSNVGFQLVGCRISISRMSECRISDF